MSVDKGHVEGRATMEHQKKEVILNLQKAWLAHPKLRLGQLLFNVLSQHKNGHLDLFYIEDYVLMNLINEFSAPTIEPIDPQITIQIIK